METVIEKNNLKKKPRLAKDNAVHALYRITMNNQLKSLAIVDQKANIIIGINTILISIMMASIGLGSELVFLSFWQTMLVSLPYLVLIIFCVISGIIAIMVVRPTSKLWFGDNPGSLFFKNFNNMDLPQFKSEMKEALKTKESIYNTLDTDIYLTGITIQRKYRLVRYAYLVFMLGLTISAALFIVQRFIK